MLPMQKFAICLDNQDYRASLEPKKLYEIIPDRQAAKHKMIRIIDESGEDYLFPENLFAELPLPEQIAEKLKKNCLSGNCLFLRAAPIISSLRPSRLI